MRLAWPAPRHLIVPLLISVAALAMVHLSPYSLTEILSPLALILVFLVPGYLAVLWAYPGKGDLSRRGRTVLSLGASVFFTGAVGLILWSTPRGLQSGSLATLLSLLSIFLFAMAYMRWSELPRNRRFFLWPRRGLRPGPNASRQSSITGRRAAYAILLLAALLIAAISLSSGPQHIFWEDISSRFHEPSPDPGAGRYEPLFTLTKDNQPQVDLAANASSPEDAQSPALGQGQNSSSRSNDIAINATASSAANNTRREISRTGREMGFFGGGGGGGTGSSKETSTSSQSKKAASSPANGPEPEKAPAPEETDGQNLTAKGNVSDQSSPDSSINQSGNSTSPVASDVMQAAGVDFQASALASSGNRSSDETLKAGQPDEAEQYSQPKASESAATSAPEPSQMAASSAALAPAAAPIKSGSPPDNANAGLAEPSESAERAEVNASSYGSDSNHPPILESLIPNRASPQPPGTAIFWRAKAADFEGDRIFYKFLINGQEAKEWSRIAGWSWLTSGLSPGNYAISVLVRDGNHASEGSFDHMINSSFMLSPVNQPPALADLISDRSSPTELGGSINWIARAVDPDNDIVYYRFLKNGQEAANWSASPAWSWDTSSESAGEYVISVMARDGGHASQDSFDSSMERDFVLIQSNGIPEISDLQADRPGPQPQGAAVTWTASGLDPEGDAIYYRFMIDNRSAGEWSTSNSWTWNTSSAKPGMHSIISQARDGKHASSRDFDSSKEAVFEIIPSNQPPILASLQPDIDSPQAQGAAVTWTAGAADREGDQIFYKFLLNGRDMTGWSTSPTWQWASSGQSIGEHKIRAMVRDGLHAPENSFDDYMDSTFSLISDIDLQIETLQRK